MAQQEEFDIRELYPLEKYLSVLLESYPKPVRAAKLAEKTGYTKAAVSKIRERLLKVCDRRPLVFGKGFILSTKTNVLFPIFIVFLVHGKHQKFLKSRFFRAFIDGKRIHSRLVTQFPIYGERFSEDDTTFFIKKIVESIERLPPKDFKFLLKIFSSRKTDKLVFFQHMENFQKILNNLKLSFNNKNEVLKTVSIRDKFFFLIRDVLWTKINDMEIIKKQDSDTRKAYQIVYKDTIDFYLRKAFEDINKKLLNSAKTLFPDDVEKKTKIGASHFMPESNNE